MSFRRRRVVLDRLQVAYLAGLMDAAGTIECYRKPGPKSKSPTFHLGISFTLTTSEPLQTVGRWLGCEIKRYAWRKTPDISHYRLRVPRAIAVDVLTECLPLLIRKRQRVEIVLAIEHLRSKYSPDRRHVGQPFLGRLPLRAVARMQGLHSKLLALG